MMPQVCFYIGHTRALYLFFFLSFLSRYEHKVKSIRSSSIAYVFYLYPGYVYYMHDIIYNHHRAHSNDSME